MEIEQLLRRVDGTPFYEGWKSVRGNPAVRLGVLPEDIIDFDPMFPEIALRAHKVFTLRGGGVSLGDTRVRYVPRRWTCAEDNPRAIFTGPLTGIYFWVRREFLDISARWRVAPGPLRALIRQTLNS